MTSQFVEHPLPDLKPNSTVEYVKFGSLGINNVLLFRSAGGMLYLLIENTDDKSKVLIRADHLAELVNLVEEAEEAEEETGDADN